MNKLIFDRFLPPEDDRDFEAEREAEHQRELFLRYVQRGGNLPEVRAQLLARCENGDPLTGRKGLRRELAAFDLQYFGMAYLPHYYSTAPPPFHDELDQIWFGNVLKGQSVIADPKIINRKQGCREAIAAPRGHAKSTTVTLKDTLHAILFEYKHYILILSDSSDQAEAFLSDIRSELEDNSRIREDFGELKGSRYWTTSGILTSTGVKIEGIGSGKKIRGRRHKQWRPDLIVLDDIENDENINTPDQRKKLKNWFDKAVSSAGDTYTDIVYVGTVLHYDSLLCAVMAKPDFERHKYQAIVSWATHDELWDAWKQIYTDIGNPAHKEDAEAFYALNKSEMLEGTAVLWEAKLSYYDLMMRKCSLGDAAFNSEYQNDPIDPSTCPFSDQTIKFYDDAPPDFRDNKFVFFGACDPSLGKNKNADTSSLIALALDTHSGLLYPVEADIKQRPPDQIITDAIAMHRRLQLMYGRGFRLFGVENVQFQSFFATVMARESAKLGVYLPVIEIPSLLPKNIRIGSLIPFVSNGYILFTSKHKELLKQMREYPMGKNDDAPDCLEMVVKLAITAKGTTHADYKTVQRRGLHFKKGCY